MLKLEQYKYKYELCLNNATFMLRFVFVQVTSLDAVQDVKQFLYETADTCYFTSFDIHMLFICIMIYAMILLRFVFGGTKIE